VLTNKAAIFPDMEIWILCSKFDIVVKRVFVRDSEIGWCEVIAIAKITNISPRYLDIIERLGTMGTTRFGNPVVGSACLADFHIFGGNRSYPAPARVAMAEWCFVGDT